MSTQPDSDPELKAVEAALGSLAPSPGRLDRDRVMYQAGRAAARSGRLTRAGWPALAAGLAVLATGEAALLSRGPAVRYVDREVVVVRPAPGSEATAPPAVVPREPEPAPAAPALAWADADDLRRRAQLFRLGLDALPEPPTTAPRGDRAPRGAQPASALLQSEVDAILNPGDPL